MEPAFLGTIVGSSDSSRHFEEIAVANAVLDRSVSSKSARSRGAQSGRPSAKHQREMTPKPIRGIGSRVSTNTRLNKCQLAHYIKTHYPPGSGEPPTRAQIAEELLETGMFVYKGPTKGFCRMDLEGTRNFVNDTMSKSCQPRTTWEEFCNDPLEVLKDDVLSYWPEFCKSLGDEKTSDDHGRPSKSSSSTTSSVAECTSESASTARSQPNKPKDNPQGSFRIRISPQDLLARKSTKEVPIYQQSSSESRAQSIGETDCSPRCPMSNDQDPLPAASAQMEEHRRIDNVPSPRRPTSNDQDPQPDTSFRKEEHHHIDNAPLGIPAQVEMRANEQDFHIDYSELATALQGIFSQTKSQIHQDLVERGRASVLPAKFNLNQSPELHLLYDAIVGRKQAGVRKLEIVSSLYEEDLCVSMCGAFICQIVLKGTLDVSFTGSQANQHPLAKEIDRILRQKHSKLEQHRDALSMLTMRTGTNQDTLFRRAYWSHLHDQAWVQDCLVPKADSLAERLAATIEQHLGIHECGPTLYRLSQRFSEIMLRSLLLKCKISVAREQVQILWNVAGEQVDLDFMEIPQDDHEHVLLTIFPGLQMGGNGPYAEVVFKAQVESRR